MEECDQRRSAGKRIGLKVTGPFSTCQYKRAQNSCGTFAAEAISIVQETNAACTTQFNKPVLYPEPASAANVARLSTF